jgi:carbon-monoxide dehydrogenase catalytic subunit
MANLGVLKQEMVNIIVHGHEPVLSEMIVEAANDKRLINLALSKGAKGINICGMCCTGNEILMRHGVPVAGNFLQQELAIVTGVVEAMVVDVQCIFPSLGNLAKCYHTKFISTSAKAHFPQAIHMELDEKDAYQTAFSIVESAVNNFTNRKKSAVFIPPEAMEASVGFSVEAIANALGGTFDPLIEVIKAGHIRGIAAVVGCNNPKVQHDYSHIKLIEKLIKNNVLVVTTGCNAIACAKAGLLSVDAAETAGQGLKAVCNQIGIPPVLHMGSCVDISRILRVAAAMAQALECDISDLPLAAAAPEWMSQKAVSIAAYVLGSGIFTVLGTIPPVLGSKEVTNLLCNKIEELLGAKFAVEVDPEISASLMIDHIENKRVSLLGETVAKEGSECMSLS